MKVTPVVVIGSMALLAGPSLLAATTVEISDGDTSSQVGISDVARRGAVIAGTLQNRSGDTISDVRVLIDVAFLWKDELHPGEDSPGRSVVYTVKGPIAPHGQLAFEFIPDPPLQERTDGHFTDPKVHVLGYTSVGSR